MTKVKITRKKNYPSGLLAIGFDSIEVQKPDEEGYHLVVDHCGRDVKELVALMKRCVDVDKIVVVGSV